MDGTGLTKTPTEQALESAEKLACELAEERSRDLPPVRDGGTGRWIKPWRSTDGKAFPIHSMMSRVGSFPPLLARYFIARYSVTSQVVLDPFCGKGTTVIEAAAAGRVAVGGDIAPDAVACTRAKITSLTTQEVANYIESLPPSPHASNGHKGVPSKVAVFFSPKTLRHTVAVRDRLLADMNNDRDGKGRCASFVLGVLLGLLHGHSAHALSLPCNQAFAMSPGYVRRYVKEHGLVRPTRDVVKCLMAKALEFLPLPHPMVDAHVIETPAERIYDSMRDLNLTADLIVTSPPYLNRQTYLKDAWLRLWLLQRQPQEIVPYSLETGNVIRFVDGMENAIKSMSRSLRGGGTAVLVCGRANITVRKRKHSVRVADLCLLANDRLSDKDKLKPVRLIIDRKLMKRGAYFAVHHGRVKGENGDHSRRYGEDEILVLRKG